MYSAIYVTNFIEWDKKSKVLKEFRSKKECFKYIKKVTSKDGKKFIVYCKEKQNENR